MSTESSISPVRCPDPACHWAVHGIPNKHTATRARHVAEHQAKEHVQSQPECLFCRPDTAQNMLVAQAATAYVRLDNFPSAAGHMEVVPRRHVASFFDLTPAEVQDIHTLACEARAYVPDVDGWTIGVNEGRAAGRTVDHLHLHLIPRQHGDVPDPRGGIRWVLPGTAPLPGDRPELVQARATTPALTPLERECLVFALDLAGDQMASCGDDFTDEEEAALATLRRLAAAAPGGQAEAVRAPAAAPELTADERTMLTAALNQVQLRIWDAANSAFTDRDQAALDSLRRRLAAAVPGEHTVDEAQQPNPLTVCVCGHSRGEHVTVSGCLLCDECDPAAVGTFVCKEFEAL